MVALIFRERNNGRLTAEEAARFAKSLVLKSMNFEYSIFHLMSSANKDRWAIRRL